MYFNSFVNNVKNIFHTLDWNHNYYIDHYNENTHNNEITFNVFGYELEIFSIRFTEKFIHIVIPFINRANFKKRFTIDEIFLAMSFLEFHVNHYIQSFMNDSYRYETISNLQNYYKSNLIEI